VGWPRGTAVPVAVNPFGSRPGDRLSWRACKALMGTAAADRGPQRPGDGASPGGLPGGPDHPRAAGRTADAQ